MNAPRPSWKVFFAGVLGGAIDAAPSISGATVYYVLGVYEDLLESISRTWRAIYETVCTRSLRPFFRETGWRFLLALKCGVLLSFLLFAKGLLLCLEEPLLRSFFFSLFFGFVLGSTSLFIKKIDVWSKKRVFLFILSFCIGIGFIHSSRLFQEPLYSVPITEKLPEASNVSSSDNRLNHVPQSALYVLQASHLIRSSSLVLSESATQNHNEPEGLKKNNSEDTAFRVEIFLLGLLVAGAMLIPGVSGSYVLNIFGYYSLVLSSILDMFSGFFSMQFSLNSFYLLLNLGLGIALGIVVFSRWILWLFTQHSSSTYACVAGGLLGTIWCLWPFQKLMYIVDPFHVAKGLHLVSTGAFIPSIAELLFAWPLIIAALVAYISVFFLQHYTQKALTLNTQSNFSS